MYARGMGGMGLDWTSILNTGISQIGNVVGAATGHTMPAYPGVYPNGYPGTYPPSTGIGGMNTTTLILLGLGAFLLVKTLK